MDSADTAPNQSEYEQFAELEKEIAGNIALWKEAREKDLHEFNTLVQRAGLGVVVLSEGKREGETGDSN